MTAPKKKLCFWTLVFLMALLPKSWADGTASSGGINIFAGAGMIRCLPVDNVGSVFTSGTGLSSGAFLNFNGGFLGVEIGGQYLKRSFDVGSFNLSGKFIEIPATLMFNFGNLFTLGGGVYYAKADGNLTRQVAGRTSEVSFTQAGLKSADIGAVALGRIHLFTSSPLGLFIEGRYTITEVNVATRGVFQFVDTQIMAGLRLGKL